MPVLIAMLGVLVVHTWHSYPRPSDFRDFYFMGRSVFFIDSKAVQHSMAYTVTPTHIPEVLLLKPQIFGDARGFFYESFNQHDFEKATGVRPQFVQDNHSKSSKGVLRGLHYQTQQAQGKLVRVTAGSVFDVAVDIRKESATYGQWVGHELSAENGLQMWIPPGFAHGFLVLSEFAEFLYKTTDYYAPAFERSLYWNDPDLAIEWPHVEPILLSDKDRQDNALRFQDL